MEKALIRTRQPKEETVKKQLQKAILRKKNRLKILTAKVEMLRVELELVKHEYDVRIGRLYLKDNHLDIEILRYKHIKKLMESGLTFDEAALQIEQNFFYDETDMKHREEEINIEEEILSHRKEVDDPLKEQIKKLWKKLIFQFHPDLVSDTDEKRRREDIMKKINLAYKENDYDLLRHYENELHTENFHESTIERLEQILIDVENYIIAVAQQYRELKESEWYSWKKNIEKAKRKNVDVFKDLEKDLLDDIVKKIAILNALKKDIQSENIAVEEVALE